jgi:hypothetical protein
MITDNIISNGRNDDGDYVFDRLICCDTLNEARQMTNDLTENGMVNIRWKCRGSKFIFRCLSHVVDQTERAIELANDAWASNQQAIEDACCSRW